MNPITLRFRQPLEHAFADEYFRKGLTQTRVAFLVAAGGIGLAEPFNAIFGPDDLNQRVRLLLTVLPLLTFSTAFSILSFTRFFQRFIRLGVVAGSLGYVFMLCGETVSATEYVGWWLLGGTIYVLFLVQWLLAFSRIGFFNAAVVAILAASIWYAFSALMWSGARFDVLPTNIPGVSREVDPPREVFLLVIGLGMSLPIGYFLERHQRNDFLHRRDLATERRKSDRLLHQMLPEQIASRLREGETQIADAVTEVSVLFADISGFTPLAARLQPSDTIALLNRLFAEFDELAIKQGVEKIVTTGDGFIAVAGVPLWRPDHAEAIADLAQDLQAATPQLSAELGEELAVRIGIHCGGPVVAGVIGTTKYLYSIVGDVMNTASRMESHGVPGAIHASEAIVERLADRYEFEERGALEIKGKGPMRTYWLIGRRSDTDGNLEASVMHTARLG